MLRAVAIYRPETQTNKQNKQTEIYVSEFLPFWNFFVLSFKVQIIFTLKKMFIVCRVSPTFTPQNSHTDTHRYNYGPCLTLKSTLHCFLKLFHCMTLTITMGPEEGAAATNQSIIVINCREIVGIENVICLPM